MGNPIDRMLTEQQQSSSQRNPIDALLSGGNEQTPSPQQTGARGFFGTIKDIATKNFDPDKNDILGQELTNVVPSIAAHLVNVADDPNNNIVERGLAYGPGKILQGFNSILPGMKEVQDQSIINDRLAAQNKDTAFSNASHDLTHMFGKIGDFFRGTNSNNSTPFDPTSLPTGILKGIFAPVDAVTGLNTGDENKVLTPEERSSAIKQTVALGVAGFLGAGADAGMAATGAGKALTSGVVAGTEGVGFGAIAGANQSDQMNQMAMGIVFGGLSGGLTLAKGKLSLWRAGRNIYTPAEVEPTPVKGLLSSGTTQVGNPIPAEASPFRLAGNDFNSNPPTNFGPSQNDIQTAFDKSPSKQVVVTTVDGVQHPVTTPFAQMKDGEFRTNNGYTVKSDNVRSVHDINGKELATYKVADPNTNLARQVTDIRRLQFDPDQSIHDVLSNAQAISDSPDLDAAVLKAHLDTHPESPTIINDPRLPAAVVKDLADKYGINYHLHPQSGTMLLEGKDFALTDNQTAVFRKTGFIPDQSVSWNGKAYTLNHISGGDAYVESYGGSVYKAPVTELSQPMDFSMTRPIEGFSLGKNAAGDLFDQFKSFVTDNGDKVVPIAEAAKTYQPPKGLVRPTVFSFAGKDATIHFQSGIDQAAFAMVDPSGKLVRGLLRQDLIKEGYNMNDVLSHGRKLREYVKSEVKLGNPTVTPDVPFTPLDNSSGPMSVKELRFARPFKDVLDDFMQQRGLDDSYRGIVEKSILGNIHSEALSGADPIEVKAIKNTPITNNESIIGQAQIANYRIDYGTGGDFVVRDGPDGNIISRHGSIADALDFIKKSGSPRGIGLDDDATIPPKIGNVTLDSHTPDVTAPSVFDNNSILGQVNATINSTLPWFTDRRSWFDSIDTKHGTRLKGLIFDPIEQATRKARAMAMPYQKQLADITGTIRTLGNVKLNQLTEALETASIPELESFATPGELDAAKKLAATGGDIQQVLRYKMKEIEIGKDKTLIDDAAKKQAMDEAKQAYNISGSNEDALKIVEKIYQTDPKIVKMHKAIRLASAYLNPESALSRDDFMNKYNFNSVQRSAVKKFSNMYDELGSKFGITDKQAIFNYATHRRMFGGAADINGTLIKDTPEMTDFYASLERTGLLQDYEKNPIKALEGYVRAGFDKQIVQPVINRIKYPPASGMRTALDAELLKLPNDARLRTNDLIQRYINDARGRMPESTKAVNASVNSFLQNHLSKFFPSLKHADVNVQDWANSINKSTTIAAQGGIPAKGVRDFGTTTLKMFVYLPAKRAAEALRLADGKLAEKLIAQGHMDGHVYYNTDTIDAEHVTQGMQVRNVLSRGYDKASDIAMKISGQEAVNNRLRAGIYQETYNRVADAFKNVDLTNKAAVKRALDYTEFNEHYSAASQAEFLSKVNAGKIEEAAHYLADQTTSTIMGNYTLGNNPLGWNSLAGRLAGKFGTWSIQQRNFLGNLVSYGSTKTRVLRVAKLGAAVAGMEELEHKYGISMSPYALVKSAIFMGGPAVDAARLVGDALGGDGYRQKSAIGNLQRLLGLDSNGNMSNGSIVIPGSYGVHDWINMVHDAQNGDHKAMAGRMLGYRVNP